jgi:hypothetical protein
MKWLRTESIGWQFYDGNEHSIYILAGTRVYPKASGLS